MYFIPVVSFPLSSFSMYIFDKWVMIMYKTNFLDAWDDTVNGKFITAEIFIVE